MLLTLLYLQTSMESMQSRHSQALLKHRAELQNLRDSLTKELEQKWIQRIKSVAKIINCSVNYMQSISALYMESVLFLPFPSCSPYNYILHPHSPLPLNLMQRGECVHSSRAVTSTWRRLQGSSRRVSLAQRQSTQRGQGQVGATERPSLKKSMYT